jgi:hypothetical protein
MQRLQKTQQKKLEKLKVVPRARNAGSRERARALALQTEREAKQLRARLYDSLT